MAPRDSGRKIALADAAIALLGDEGLRALTHRATDERAGLPQGTCSYHFPTRRALLSAALERIAALDRADISAIADPAVLLAAWLGPARGRSRARLLLMLDPEARRELGATADRLANGFVDAAGSALGSASAARLTIALVDGLIADDLVRGDGEPPTIASLRVRLNAIFRAVGYPDATD